MLCFDYSEMAFSLKIVSRRQFFLNCTNSLFRVILLPFFEECYEITDRVIGHNRRERFRKGLGRVGVGLYFVASCLQLVFDTEP